MFFRGSRYEKVKTLEHVSAEGRVILYKATRYIDETRAVGTHRVRQGDRLDLIAHQYMRDPERFWRICDANRALWPADLVDVPGRFIGIPPSEG